MAGEVLLEWTSWWIKNFLVREEHLQIMLVERKRTRKHTVLWAPSDASQGLIVRS
ncbi:unnamed protein product [Larinioides sclopetarius]|uniref:Uncharacterized protein n=1 Tax=Larinioides sclopetarius TaxID=280406 RepID=A0AAV1YTA4_9ARAC